MNKEELEIWTQFYKFKSTYKKISAGFNLKSVGGFESLDNLCGEFLNNRSPIFRNDILEVIEYLELKLNPARKELEYYNQLLEKYKIPNVQNFWFKDHKKVSITNLEEEINASVDKLIWKQESKSTKLDFKYSITPNLTGIVQMTFDPKVFGNKPNHITYGFISNYRDIGGGYINDNPSNQIHHQNNIKNDFEIRIPRLFRNILPEYINFLQNLENDLLMIDEENPVLSRFYKKFTEQTDSDELWFLLSLINIQKRNKQFDKMKSTAQLGIVTQANKTAGSGWLKYYRDILGIDSNE